MKHLEMQEAIDLMNIIIGMDCSPGGLSNESDREKILNYAFWTFRTEPFQPYLYINILLEDEIGFIDAKPWRNSELDACLRHELMFTAEERIGLVKPVAVDKPYHLLEKLDGGKGYNYVHFQLKPITRYVTGDDV